MMKIDVNMISFICTFTDTQSPFHFRDVGGGDFGRRMEVNTTPPQVLSTHASQAMPIGQPMGLQHYTQGLTGRHVLAVSMFNREQVSVLDRTFILCVLKCPYNDHQSTFPIYFD